MLTTLVVCLSLAARAPWQPPPPRDPLVEKFLDRANDRFFGDLLEHNKSLTELMIAYIEWRETDLKDPTRFTPAQAERLRQQLVKFREHVKYLKKERSEMEAWLQERRLHPGSTGDLEGLNRMLKLHKEWDAWQEAWEAGRIAPMPREVKR